jgi:predicted O-methyltransferase YrrM
LGGGSSFGLKQERRVKDIIKHSAIKKKYGELLYRIVFSNGFKNVLEFGTSLGIGTLYLAKAMPDSNVLTIEGCSALASQASRNFKETGSQNIVQNIGNFDDVLPSVLENMKSIDFVFFDGNHRKEATIRYFELCLTYIHNESIFYFDDIRWSKEMYEAWQEIRLNKQVSLTIDLFFSGIVFFKNELSKQDFKIKF